MAGAMLVGIPLVGGVVGGTVLQGGMRGAGFGLGSRIAVELGLISAGAVREL